MTASIYLNLGSGIALIAVIVYAWLRHLASGKAGEHPLTVVRRHAWWTAFIALFASGTLGLSGIWNVDVGSSSPAALPVQDIWDHVPQALAPGLWLGAIYLLGQFTWPRQVGSRRSASLKVRRLTDYLPRVLTAVFAGSTLVAAGVMAWAWNTPGTASVLTLTGNDGGRVIVESQSGSTPGSGTVNTDYTALGNLPGNQIAPLLLVGLLVVVAAVLLMLFVITSRPSLSVLDPEEDTTLRTLWMNRLLRTGVMVSAGFAAATLQYVNFAREQRDAVALLSDPATTPHPAGGVVVVASGIWLLLMGLLMLFWPAPALTSPMDTTGLPGSHSPGYRAAMMVLTAVQFVVVLVLLIAGTGASLMLTEGGTQSQSVLTEVGVDGVPVQTLIESSTPSGFAGFATPALTMLILALLYYALHYGVAAWIAYKLCDGRTPSARVKRVLPRWFMITNAAMLAAALIVVALFAIDGASVGTLSAWWLAALLVVVALIGTGIMVFTQINGPLLLGSGREDATLRIIVAHRAIRVIGGMSLICIGLISDAFTSAGPLLTGIIGAQPAYDESGLSTPTAIILVLLGILWCILPAATVGQRHANSLLKSPESVQGNKTR